MRHKILNIFYNEILPSVSNNKETHINDWTYRVSFESIIGKENKKLKNYIVLKIKDKEKFDQALIDYTTNMIDHIFKSNTLKNEDNIYFDGNINNIISGIVLNVWFNATEEDFNDPIKYLKIRNKFLKEEFSNNNLGREYKTDNI